MNDTHPITDDDDVEKDGPGLEMITLPQGGCRTPKLLGNDEPWKGTDELIGGLSTGACHSITEHENKLCNGASHLQHGWPAGETRENVAFFSALESSLSDIEGPAGFALTTSTLR